VAPLAATALMAWEIGDGTLGWRGMYAVLLMLSALPILPALFAKFPNEAPHPEEKAVTWRSIAKDKVAWIVVLMLSLGVIAELAVGGWLVIFLEKVYGWTNISASGMLSAFFFCFMLARLLLGPVTDKLGFVKSIILFSAFSGLCTCAAIIVGETW